LLAAFPEITKRNSGSKCWNRVSDSLSEVGIPAERSVVSVDKRPSTAHADFGPQAANQSMHGFARVTPQATLGSHLFCELCDEGI
jgi:hypothetical protein